ncbi:ABC transporter ATP-binding protein [Weissella soli]|uniref:ABC transporter ATP-binding protein n=1 Tax=Weissella soli TaxID=155866 RepID=UPI0036F1FC3C|nr:ABC transporter ATP-binding protein [Weissella soli]
MTEKILRVAQVNKYFGKFHALKNVSFDIYAGEIFGFLGPNGAGKSTMLRTMLGMLKADSGEIELDGTSMLNNPVTTHRRIAYVPGDVSLWPGLTGGEIIDLLLRMGGHQHTAKTDALITKFALDPTKKARAYSKGNRQKVALIAAFSADVDLYIFDEPTSGLDPLQELNFQAEVLALKAAGKAVLLSSHILAEVEKMVDRLAIIRQGEIIATGNLKDLQALASLNVQAQVQRDAQALAAFPGIMHFKQVNDSLQFAVQRTDLSAVTAELAKYGLADLKVAAPTLEELFITYYHDESETGHAQ